MSISYIPEQNEYKKLTPFKRYVLQSFPWINEDFDAMTNYELMAKIIEYLNELIANDETEQENIESLYNSFVELNNYVSSYFDNLDVQTEINNKLDDLVADGTISRILNQELFQSINNAILQNTLDINANKTELLNKISENQPNSITTEMLTQEVLDAMTGGTVASVGENSIDYTNIKNNGIDLLNLSEKLMSNLLKDFTPITLSNPSSGYWSRNASTNKPVLNSSTIYQYYEINLTKGKIYKVNCYDAYATNGFIVFDPNNSNDIIFYSNKTFQSGQGMSGFYFRPNKSGLKAYVSFPNSSMWGGNNYQWVKTAYDLTGVYELTDTEILLKDYNKVNLINILPFKTLDNSYVDIYPHTDENTNIKFIKEFVSSSPTNYHIAFFYIQKGETYKIKYYNAYSMAGLCILQLNGNCTFISSDTNLNNYEEEEREFTASEDGYIVVSYNTSHPVTVQKYVPFGDDITNKLYNKTLYADGDSIVYGDDNDGESFVDYIAVNNNMTLTKKAVNGTTIAKRNGYSNSILERVETTANNSEYYDYIIIEGGFNDFFNNVPIGSITSGLDDELNEYTFAGALEKISKILVTKFSSGKFLFVLAHKKVNQYYETQIDYWDIAEQIFQKWSIPYINLSKESGLVPINQTLLSTYFGDEGLGTHPNELGFKTFYVPKVTSKMLTL